MPYAELIRSIYKGYLDYKAFTNIADAQLFKELSFTFGVSPITAKTIVDREKLKALAKVILAPDIRKAKTTNHSPLRATNKMQRDRELVNKIELGEKVSIPIRTDMKIRYLDGVVVGKYPTYISVRVNNRIESVLVTDAVCIRRLKHENIPV